MRIDLRQFARDFVALAKRSPKAAIAVFFTAVYLLPIMAVVIPFQGLGSLVYAALCWAIARERRQLRFWKTFRRAMTVQAHVHGRVMLWCLERLLDFRVEVHLDPSAENLGTVLRSLLVVPNHLSIMDIPLVCLVMKLIGRGGGVRWIMKEFPRWFPLRWAANWIGCGFVKRGGKTTIQQDIESIEACAALAYADNDDPLIFPEGTRRTEGVVADPKSTGFDALRAKMPLSDVLTIVFRWVGDVGGTLGRDTFSAATDLMGRTIEVHVKRVPRDQIDDQWLGRHFTEVREFLSGAN